MTDEWSRIMWANVAARDVWEPRLQAIHAAWYRVEVQSVIQHYRDAGLVFGQPQGVPMTPVGGDRFAIGPYAADLAMALKNRDDHAVGELLGYPVCCRTFFADTWNRGTLDTTAQMKGDGNGPIECNILARWLGVRFVMHLPCSWTCDATVDVARSFRKLWTEQEYQWAHEILSWPVLWTARHGIAEISYPVCKVSARTTPNLLATIHRTGIPPKEAARGVTYPYDQERLPKSGLESLIMMRDLTAKANGFSSFEAMESAHQMVLGTLAQSPPHGLTIDLGCGNGRLMRKVGQQFGVPVKGVEADVNKVPFDDDVIIQDLHWTDQLPTNADTLIVSQRRFEEIPALELWTLAHARQVLVYSYDVPMFADIRKGAA